MADTKKTVHLIIERQDSPTGKPYTEEFEIPYRPALNVVAALMEIQKNIHIYYQQINLCRWIFNH